MIDSIPLCEIKSTEHVQETLNDTNHQADEDDSARTQLQSLLKRKPTVPRPPDIESSKQGSYSETAIGLEASRTNSGIAGKQAIGGNFEVSTRMMHSNVIQIKTDRDGHNSGRTYYLRTKESDDIVTILSGLAKSARRRAENKSRFERHQLQVRTVYNSPPFQYLVAALIFGVVMHFDPFQFEQLYHLLVTLTSRQFCHQNFVANATEAQLSGTLQDSDGAQTSAGLILKRMDVFFTTIFTCELAVNMYAYWLTPFMTNSW